MGARFAFTRVLVYNVSSAIPFCQLSHCKQLPLIVFFSLHFQRFDQYQSISRSQYDPKQTDTIGVWLALTSVSTLAMVFL